MSSTNPPGQGRDDGDRPGASPWPGDHSGTGGSQDPGPTQYGSQGGAQPPQYGSPGAYQPPQYSSQGAPQYGSQGGHQPPQYGGEQGDHRGSPTPPYGGGQGDYQQPGYSPSYGGPGQYGPGGSDQPRNGLGIAALVVGIVSLLVAWLPFLGLISVLGGVVGIVLGAMGLKRVNRGEATNRGTSIAGIVVSVVAILLAIAATVYGSYFISQVMPDLFGPEFQECVESAGDSQEELERCLQESGL